MVYGFRGLQGGIIYWTLTLCGLWNFVGLWFCRFGGSEDFRGLLVSLRGLRFLSRYAVNYRFNALCRVDIIY